MKNKSSLLLKLFTALLLCSFEMMAQPVLDVTEIADGFNRPVDIVYDGADDNKLYIVEQRGVIRTMDLNGNIDPDVFLDIEDRVLDAANEQGLLGLAFPPDFATSQVFYVNYTTGNASGRTRVSRFAIDANDPNVADPGTEDILLDFNQTSSFGNHNGGDLAFGSDGLLYIASGDGGGSGDGPNNAQNINNLLGTILRIDVDTTDHYKIPPDNPFVDASGEDEIWSYGLRNPWRISFDRKTGDFWIADVGQGAREEVNFEPEDAEGGINYGWRCYEGLQPFNNAGCNGSYTFPIFQYPHNNNTGGFSVTGGYVYRGILHPYLDGNYIFCDYVSGNFWMTSVSDADGSWQTFRQNGLVGGISSFGEDANGELYVAQLSSGKIFKLGASCPDIAFPVEISQAGDDLVADRETGTFQWFLDGNAIPGATGSSYTPVESGDYYVEVIINDMGCIYYSTSNTLTFTVATAVFDRNYDLLSAYPNPASDQLIIDLGDIDVHAVQSVYLQSVNGQELPVRFQVESNRIVLDISAIETGYYQAVLQSGDGRYISRFLKH